MLKPEIYSGLDLYMNDDSKAIDTVLNCMR